MARKTINYTIIEEGRDKGKTFVITELSASRAESWAMRAILALMAGGVELPEHFEKLGMSAIAEIGIKALAGLRWEVAEPLLAEMWQCVRIMPDPLKPQLVRELIEEDIEEIATRIILRKEVCNLHVDFLKAVAPSILKESQATAKGEKLHHTKI